MRKYNSAATLLDIVISKARVPVTLISQAIGTLAAK